MESGHDSRIAYWDHEPGNPGGETPPSTAGGTPAATDARFPESNPEIGPSGLGLSRGWTILDPVVPPSTNHRCPRHPCCRLVLRT